MRKLTLMVGLVASLVLSASPASAQSSGNQRFTVIISGRGEGTTDTARVVAAGPIRGLGTFEETENPDVVRFVFPDGSITLDAPEDESTGSEEFNERTCSGSFTFSGPFEIIEGTGAYHGATGSGTFEGRGRFIGRPTAEGCSEDGFFFLVVRVKGTVDLHGQAAA
ncbi:MAG: hypothetical protein M3P97_10835 [Actinomycetota bacterium]|nr:hypothetical protein [Actinomycetota bacterium]